MQTSALEVVSIVSALVSTALAIFAIWQANGARRETQINSAHIGEVLKEIQGYSVMIKEDVARSQQDIHDNIVETQKSLMEMQRGLVDAFTKRFEADIPQRVSPTDQFMMNLLTESPEKLTEIIQLFQEAQAKAQKSSGVEEPSPQT